MTTELDGPYGLRDLANKLAAEGSVFEVAVRDAIGEIERARAPRGTAGLQTQLPGPWPRFKRWFCPRAPRPDIASILIAIAPLVSEYADAIGKHGPDSDQARGVRVKYAAVSGFGDLADALDRVKRRLGGSGVDRALERKES